MDRPQLSRRTFLTLAGGAVLVVACGDDGEGGDGAQDLGAGRVSPDVYATTEPQRFAFAVLSPTGQVSGGAARVAFAPEGEPLPEPAEAELHDEGLPEGRGVYTVRHVFDRPGVWDGEATYDGQVIPLPVQVAPTPGAPPVGAPALSVPTATLDDPLGVDPICTLDPQCPFHDVSLDDALAAAKPIVVQFATPARCQTQYCGPTLQALVDVGDDYRDRVEIIHVEIYPDLRSPSVVDAVGPAGWNLPSEPWMYAIVDGVIVERLGGAFDRSETLAMLEGVL